MYSEPSISMKEIAGCDCSICRKAREEKSELIHKPRTDYDNLSIKKIGELVDDSGCRIGYLLCSRKLKGFVFSSRVWGEIFLFQSILRFKSLSC